MAFEQFSLDIDSLHLYDSPLSLSTVTKTNLETSHRKRIKKIATDPITKESFFHKSVHNDIETDSVENLIREFSFLEKLSSSGVTPKPYILKVSHDGSRATVAMEALPGKSLRERESKSRRINPEHFSSLLTETFNALEIVHQNGILVGDITSESFIIDLFKREGIKRVRIVDFEHAIDGSEIETLPDYIKRWYAHGDIGLYRQLLLNNGSISFDEYVLTEQYITAMTLMRYMLGDSYHWTVDTDSLSETDVMLFQEQARDLLSIVTQKAEAVIMRRYMRFGEDCAREIAHQEGIGKVKEDMKIYMINITLPSILEQKGIEVEEELVRQLQRILNPNLQKRLSRVI